MGLLGDTLFSDPAEWAKPIILLTVHVQDLSTKNQDLTAKVKECCFNWVGKSLDSYHITALQIRNIKGTD